MVRLSPTNILWVDCTAAGVAGALTLLLRDWLAALYAIPVDLLTITALVNLAYGSYSFSLALRAHRPAALIKLLAMANAMWAPVCIGLVIYWWPMLSGFAVAHYLGEAAIVVTLAVLEWRWRYRLVTADKSPPPDSG